MMPLQAVRPGTQVPGTLAPVGLRLVDIDQTRGTVVPRGVALLQGETDLLVRAGERAVALSFNRAEVVDLRDRDAPAHLGALELSRSVFDLALAGDSVVQVTQDRYQRGQRAFQLAAVPASAPQDLARSTGSTTPFVGQAGPLFGAGAFVYQFWKAGTATGEEPRLQVLQLQDGRLQPRGALSLAGPADVDFGFGPGDSPLQVGVRQLDATTFLVPLFRVRDCSARTIPGSPAPGCPDGSGATPPAPVTPPPPPPTASGACPGAEADFLVVDASNPDEPRVSSRFRLPNGAQLLTLLVRGRTVFVTQRERARRADRTTNLVRHFVTEVSLADLARPVVGAAVSAPGGLVAERASDATWVTVEPIYNPAGPPSGVMVSTLYRDARSSRAFLQRQLALPGGVSGPVADGDALFFTVDGKLVAVEPFAPGGPRVRSRTAVLDASVSGDGGPLGSGFPRDLPGDPPVYPSPANLHRAVNGQVFVVYRHGVMLIYDARDRDRPVRLDRFVVTSDRTPVLPVAGNRALLTRDGWGIEVVALPAL